MLFEQGAVYLERAGERLPDEHRAVGGLLHGRLHPPTWGVPDPPRAGFFTVKGVVAALLDALRVGWRVEAASEPFLHPGRAARLLAGDDELGWVGELHPLVARAWDLEDVAAFELDLDRAVEHAVVVPRFRDVTSFPPVRQDLAVVVGDDVAAQTVVDAVRTAGGELLAGVRVFDVYRGSQIGEGRISLALALTFQAPDRTLADEDVVPLREQIVTALTALGGELRG
jgi:phenylalanyl-tRNA synthetase beta chain